MLAFHFQSCLPAWAARAMSDGNGRAIVQLGILITLLFFPGQAANAQQGQISSVGGTVGVSVWSGRTALVGGYCYSRAQIDGGVWARTFDGRVSSASPGTAMCSGACSAPVPCRRGQNVWIALETPTPLPDGTLEIRTTPNNATVRIGASTPGSRNLRLAPATYNVQISALGYVTERHNVVIRSGRPTLLSVVLEPGRGQVCADGRPPPCRVQSGVTFTSELDSVAVKVDGEFLGTTPVTERLSDGAHHVSYELEGYYARVDSIVVHPDSARTIAIGLDRKLGALDVFTYPAGAIVFIGGDSAATPYHAQLPLDHLTNTRIYPYQIRMPGYETVTGQVHVDAIYAYNSVIDTTLTPLAGWIRARSEPIGAVVLVDNEEIGVAPLDFRVAPDRYEVTIRGGASRTVTIVAGGDERVGEGPEPVDFVVLRPDPPRPEPPPPTPPQRPPEPPVTPLPPSGTPVDELIEAARREIEHGRYDQAYALYLQAQSSNPGSLEIARLIGRLHAALDQVRRLTEQQLETRSNLHASMYQDADTGKCDDFRSSSQRLSQLVTNDPATYELVRRACADRINPGAGPTIDLVYIYGSTEYQTGNPAVENVDDPPYVGFLLSATEITNTQFARFLHENRELGIRDANGKRMVVRELRGIEDDRREGWRAVPGLEDLPAVDATWYGANAYAEWAGGRLPRVSEWQWAFAIGSSEAEGPREGNCEGTLGNDRWENEVAPVHRFAPDGLGLHDMAGNAWEWADYELADNGNKRRTILGGSFRTRPGTCFQDASGEVDADSNNTEIGFRLLIPLD